MVPSNHQFAKYLFSLVCVLTLVACSVAQVPTVPVTFPLPSPTSTKPASPSPTVTNIGLGEDAFRIIDHMVELSQFFDDARELPDEEKIKEFKARIIEPNLKYYSMLLMGISDDGIRQYIKEIEPRIGTISSGQERVLQSFQAVAMSFREKFPHFRGDFEIHLLPSLNLFKGMAVPIENETILLLGIDELVDLSENHLRGYLTHELFHVYHYQSVPAVRINTERFMQTQQMPPLWALLWTEGMASHAVRMVYPEIKEDEILDWRPLVVQTKPLISDLAGEARRVLRSDLPQDVSGFFYFPREGDREIPTGCGYYIGMVIVSMLAQDYSIDELLRLDDEALINKIDSALIELQNQ